MGAVREIGDIKIVAEISQSATTQVYKAFQPSRERWVLVKILRPEFTQDSDFVKRFQEEAKIVSRIDHPNVVSIYDHGNDAGVSYLAAEFVDGLDLYELLKKGAIPPAIAWFILLNTAKGLQAAHEKGIVHQDIKPSNILISNEGAVKLTDFGMANLTYSLESEHQEETKGTLGFFSPEQILGEAIDCYSDVFSLGATFYEMLAGTPAFHGHGASDYFKSILNDDPTQYLKSSNVPEKLAEICSRMLAKKALDRFKSCSELISELEVFRAGHRFKADPEELSRFLAQPTSYESRIEELPAIQISVSKPKSRTYFASAALLIIFFLVIGYYAFGRHSGQKGLDTRVAAQNTRESPTVSLQPAASRNQKELENPLASRTNGAPKKDSVTSAQPRPASTSIPGEISPLGADPVPDTGLEGSVEGNEASGYMTILCTPWAYVFVDGDSIGVTPLQSALPLEAGRHKLTLRNPNFPDHNVLIEIQGGQTAEHDFSFWSTVAQLRLDISPWADVFVNNEYKDTIPPQQKPLILLPGEHLLTLKNPTLGQWETRIEVEAGKSTELQFNLRSLLSK